MQFYIRQGLDLTLLGQPEQRIFDAPAARAVGMIGHDYNNLRPILALSPGDRVKLGETLFTDRRTPELRVTAPVSGTITAINVGAKRKILAIVIETSDEPGVSFDVADIASAVQPDSRAIREVLLQSGVWTGFRVRPTHGIASPNRKPDAILINALDTAPLAPDPTVIIADALEPFQTGVRLISALCETTVLSASPALTIDESKIGHCRIARFDGPHPAGLAGTQISCLGLAGPERETWVIGYQDVIAIGRLFMTGSICNERIVSVAGSGIEQPRLLRTQLGVSLNNLLEGQCKANVRVISGSVLSGRAVTPSAAYVGRYDVQVSVLEDVPQHAMSLTGEKRIRGQRAGMLTVEAFERVWPFDTPPIALLRALLADDLDTADALGCRDLHPEDLALCSYVCPADLDYGAALTRVQERLEGAR